MSFGTHLPSPAKKSLLDDPNLNSTNEEAHPLQYVAGWQRVGITWIDQPRNQRSVAQKSGGKSSATTGYKYYADMLALVCYGPVDGITHVLMDSDVVWQGSVIRGGEESVTINLPGRGSMILFWGREDQSACAPLAALGHPPYRGQCYAYFPQLGFGNGRTAAPNVEFGIKRTPKIDWLPGLPNSSDDANLVAVMAELLTSPIFGQGIDLASIDQAQWLATAQQLAAEDLVASPLISDGTGVRQLVTQVLEYFYGYLRWTRGGKLQIGLLRDTPADLSALVKLTATDLVDAPEITIGDWSTTFNRTVVTNLDRTIYWQDSYAQWFDQGNLAITNQILFQSLERRWITRNSVAASLAQRAGKRFALPQFTGTLLARRSSVAALEIGDWIVLDYDATYVGFALVLQVTSIKGSGETTEQIELEVTGQQITTDPSELADANEFLKPLPDAAATVTAPAQWAVLEMPTALAGGKPGVVVAALVVRGSFDTIYANVLDSQDDATYDLLGMINQFASGGTLAADYSPAADATVAMVVNLLGPDTELPSVSALAAANDKLLVFVGYEILAVEQVTVVSATQVQLFCVRGQYDVGAQPHAAGDQVYMIAKRDLRPFNVDAFSPADQVWFKVQSASLGDQYDLSLVAAQELGMIGRAKLPAPFTSLAINGSRGLATYTSSSNIAMQWKLATSQQIGGQTYSAAFYAASGIATEIRIYDNPTSLNQMDRITVVPGVNTYTYTPSQVTAAFGTAPTTFYVRLWSISAGLFSYSFTDCVVNLAGSTGGGAPTGGGGVGGPGGIHYLN